MTITEVPLYEFTKDGDERDPLRFPMLVGAEALYSGSLEAQVDTNEHFRRLGAPVVAEQLVDTNY